MILQAPSTPPNSNKVYGKAELKEALRAVKAFGLIPSAPPVPTFIERFQSFSISVPYGATSDFVIDTSLVLANTGLVSGQPYRVYGFAVEPTNFISNVPTVNYNIVSSEIGLDLSVSQATYSNLGFVAQTNAMVFSCPYCYAEGRVMYSQSISDSTRACVISGTTNLSGYTFGEVIPFNTDNDYFATAVSITVPGTSAWGFRVFVAYIDQL